MTCHTLTSYKVCLVLTGGDARQIIQTKRSKERHLTWN